MALFLKSCFSNKPLEVESDTPTPIRFVSIFTALGSQCQGKHKSKQNKQGRGESCRPVLSGSEPRASAPVEMQSRKTRGDPSRSPRIPNTDECFSPGLFLCTMSGFASPTRDSLFSSHKGTLGDTSCHRAARNPEPLPTRTSSVHLRAPGSSEPGLLFTQRSNVLLFLGNQCWGELGPNPAVFFLSVFVFCSAGVGIWGLHTNLHPSHLCLLCVLV